jgi:serine/threonine-protein kinase HipA
MSTRKRVALINGTTIGKVVRNRNGRSRFTYAAASRQHPDAISLSLSIPLVRTEHPQAAIDAFQ